MRSRYRKKAYLELLKNKNFSLIWSIRKDLQKIKFSKKISTYYDRELSARQYFLFLFGQEKLDKAILFSLGAKMKIKFFPLHPLHLYPLRNKGIKVSRIWTFLTFIAVNLIIQLKAISFFTKLFLQSFYNRNNFQEDKDFLFFMDLTEKNLPNPHSDGKSYDIISWYINWKNPKANFIYHDALNSKKNILFNGKQINHSTSFLPQITSKKRFFLQGAKLILNSLFNLFQLKLDSSLLIYEDLKALIFRLAKSDQIAKEYIFPFSTNFYRPIWTYEAEKRGSKITLYHYSGGKPIKPCNSKLSLFAYEALLNWPKILVWDVQYLNMIKKELIHVKEIEVVGPIDFVGSNQALPLTKKVRIAVFDTPPTNYNDFPLTASVEKGLAETEVHLQFLNDIIDVSKNTSFIVCIKPKRKALSSQKIDKYLSSVSELSKNENVLLLNPEISARRLIENSEITISFPFTSPSLIANFLGKKTIYYDPTGLVSKKDKGNSNVLLLSKKIELKKWFLKRDNHKIS